MKTKTPSKEAKPHIAERMANRVHIDRAGRPSPGFVRFLRRVLGPIVRLAFRPTLHGWENLPRDRPYLVVANHSGGGWAEILSISWLWLVHHAPRPGGDVPPLAGMAHPGLYSLPGFAALVRGMGAIPSTYKAAEAALAQGTPVLVFPGGDFETFRPIWQANRVDFAGRQGFLKIARKTWVPIVPMRIRGSHVTAPMLWRSRTLACLAVYPRLLGGKFIPVSLLGILGAALIVSLLGGVIGYPLSVVLALVWMTCPFAYFIPIFPSRIRFVVGKVMEPEDLFESRDSSGSLADAYGRVQETVQQLGAPSP